MAEEKKGFVDKIKEFFARLKEENKGFGAAMKRINSSGFCGNVNRGVKNGDFWEGSYVNIEEGHAVIYGSNQGDYTFVGSQVVSFTPGKSVEIASGNNRLSGIRYTLVLEDGKTAQIDLINAKSELFKGTLGL